MVFFVISECEAAEAENQVPIVNGRHETDGMEDRQWNIAPTKWKLGRLRPENIIAKGLK